jgi:hypothetical protein
MGRQKFLSIDLARSRQSWERSSHQVQQPQWRILTSSRSGQTTVQLRLYTVKVWRTPRTQAHEGVNERGQAGIRYNGNLFNDYIVSRK